MYVYTKPDSHIFLSLSLCMDYGQQSHTIMFCFPESKHKALEGGNSVLLLETFFIRVYKYVV